MSKQRTPSFSEAQLSLFPELRYFVDGQVPVEDLHAYFRVQRGWPTVTTVVLSVLLVPLAVLLLHRGFGVGIVPTIAVVISGQLLISWLLLGLLFPALQRRPIRAALRKQLQASGIHPCTDCAYDMRSTPERCPECGARGEASSEAESSSN